MRYFLNLKRPARAYQGRTSQWIMPLICATLISSCSLVPGIRTDDLPDLPQQVTPLANGLQVQLLPVTAELVNQLAVPQTNFNQALSQLFSQQPANNYVLQKGDVLSIYLWAYPELTPPLTSVTPINAEQVGFKVDQEGNLSFPLIKQIHAAGKTVTSLQRELNQRLSHYLKQPDAQIKVLQFKGRKFFVDGEVRLPGQYVISDEPLNLYGALSAAGGMLNTGDLNAISLTRQGVNYQFGLLDLQKQGLSPNQLYMQNGDELHILSRESRKIYFLGEAGRPAPLILREQGMSLADVIGEGAGLNPLSANPAKVYVLRDDAQTNLATVYQLDLSSFTSLALAQRFAVQPKDIIYVDASGLARWSRVLNLLLPSATAIRTGQLIGNGN
ncbi:MAG: hypothetical protein EOO69_04990 [Moraxellaceae bacterium]|nr:MAG: hypothetical protein EOO69_04990 [Moraxellaceae bacterium]